MKNPVNSDFLYGLSRLWYFFNKLYLAFYLRAYLNPDISWPKSPLTYENINQSHRFNTMLHIILDHLALFSISDINSLR